MALPAQEPLETFVLPVRSLAGPELSSMFRVGIPVASTPMVAPLRCKAAIRNVVQVDVLLFKVARAQALQVEAQCAS